MYGYYSSGNFSVHSGINLPKIVTLNNSNSRNDGIVIQQSTPTYSSVFLEICKNSNLNAEKSKIKLIDHLNESDTNNTFSNPIFLFSLSPISQNNPIPDGFTLVSQLSNITGMCVNNRNLYTVNQINGLLQKIELTTLNVTTIAGGGSPITQSQYGGQSVYPYYGDGGNSINAQFNEPIDVVFDNIGNMYISDKLNNVIRKIDGTGIITTIAGKGIDVVSGENIYKTSVQGYAGDGGLAILAQLNYPMGLAFETYQNNGYLYIADNGNNRIRQVNLSTGNINTIAGNGISGYSGDGGQAVSAQLNSPTFICISNHILYMNDSGNNVIRKIDLSSGIITTFAGNIYGSASSVPITLNTPANGAFITLLGGICSDNNYLYATCYQYNRSSICKIDLNSGNIVDLIGTLNNPTTITTDGSKLYVYNSGNIIQK